MTTFAIPALFDLAKAQLAADGSSCRFSFGYRESAKQVNVGFPAANRCVWYPGDASGKAGAYAPPRSPGTNPRPLRTWLETATVMVWAQDPTSPNDERAQYDAVRSLHDAVVRAIVLGAESLRSLVEFSSPQWIRDGAVERVFGAELSFQITVQSRIVDEAWREVAPTSDVTYILVPPSVDV